MRKKKTTDSQGAVLALSSTLSTFGMKHAAKHLQEAFEYAGKNELTYREFLEYLSEIEINNRNERRRTRNLSGAHFPPNPPRIEEFDVSELESGITNGQIRQLQEMNWADLHGNLIFAGPPGLGKTMLAVALGIDAVYAGYTVCYERMNNFVRILSDAEKERRSGFRMKNIRRADIVIIDEVGYTPITREQANLFYTFVSEAEGNKSLIFTTNKDVSEWAEVFGDAILTSALLDRLISHAKCFSFKGTSYRMKHPQEF